jgi:hypothetical protein
VDPNVDLSSEEEWGLKLDIIRRNYPALGDAGGDKVCIQEFLDLCPYHWREGNSYSKNIPSPLHITQPWMRKERVCLVMIGYLATSK